MKDTMTSLLVRKPFEQFNISGVLKQGCILAIVLLN